jgi:hypothetical protein
MDQSLQNGQKATPGQEIDLIREIQELITKKQLRAKIVDERPRDATAGDTCTHCNSCPCMFIG